jgi:hypothetical protein
MAQKFFLTHEFVEFIPEQLKDGILYVSIPYGLAVHKCCCGCQNKVVTPFSPRDWKLTYDGETVTLNPSIGNWKFPCQSHYWIRENHVVWVKNFEKPVSTQKDKGIKTNKASQKKKHFFSFIFSKKS